MKFFGIDEALMTTVHATTATQMTVDRSILEKIGEVVEVALIEYYPAFHQVLAARLQLLKGFILSLKGNLTRDGF